PGGLRGRVNTSTGQSYAAWIYPGTGRIKLFRAAAWHIDTAGLAVLADVSATIAAGVTHTLALDFQGSQISVIYNGTTVIQVADATLASGAVALDVSNQPIRFDDVLVTSGSTTLFSDDFSPRPLRSWTASPLTGGTWDASSGVAAYDGGGHTQLYAGNPAWTDYTVEAKVRVTNAADYPGGIRGRLNTSTGGSYAAWIYPGSGKVKLWRNSVWHVDTPPTTMLAEANATIATSTFHTLAIQFKGSRIKVSLNGTVLIDITDTTYASGAVALDVSNQPIDYDDVLVTQPAADTQLFADNFSTNSLGNWTPSPLGLFSNWTAASGYASYNGGGHTQIYTGNDQWTDYTFKTKFRLAVAQNHPGGIRGRVNTATGESYAAWIYPGDGQIKLFRAAAWNIDTEGLALLATANVSIPAEVWHDLELTFEGSQITVTYNGTDVIYVSDTVLPAGAIALDVSNKQIDFDDVVVTSTTPPSGDTDNGPGGPVLVISKSTNPFTRYYGEILKAEGLNHFAIREIGTLTANVLAAYDVAILGETTLTSAQVTLLSNWVNAGGNLIAMRPDPQLATLLGITSASGSLSEGYLLASGQGIVNQTIQYHGAADLYTLNGATAIATLYSDATTPTSNPAVTLRSVGSAGGQAAAFTYDLARSIVYTRQGNPAWAGQERDGHTPIRSSDLFFPDWVNLDKAQIPQADEQQRLLANLILNMASKPLPRFWYFPRGEKAVVLMTGDDHGNNGTAGRFQLYQQASPSNCSVADWDCVRGTSYIFPSTPISSSAAEAFEADGFEIAVHVTTSCGDWTPSSLETFYASQLASFASNFPTLDAPSTNRTHCIVWSDWVSQAQVSKDHGIRLDTNYYYWPPEWVDDRPGFMTGSGMPMRFADTDG
ncbi:MAG TPA: family 16 glycoside hydrolase, partial [Thermoanaerobaculia bacterium]|nr:family 16 glycoside hydrolase [Thermoanaerobaculia bacterium]